MPAGPLHRLPPQLGKAAEEDVLHQGGLARAGDPCDTNQPIEGNLDVDLLEVVLGRAQDSEACAARGAGCTIGAGGPSAGEILSSEGALGIEEIARATKEDDLAAPLS